MSDARNIELRDIPPIAKPQPANGSAVAKNDADTTANQAEQPNWFARNRWFTKEPITYTAYQFFRSTLASIPYGFGMAFFHHVFSHLSHVGQRMGLNEAGLKAFAKDGIHAVDQTKEFYLPGKRAMWGRNLMRLANSPINQAMQIGLGFTLFRFTGGIVKAVRDSIMDEKNSTEETNQASKDWFKTVVKNSTIHWKAEAVGTFWGAITLGFIGGLFKQSTPYQRMALAGGAKETFVQAVKRVWSHPSKLLQNAAIWTISYSAFFEVNDRIHKDVQVREGTWKGEPNSLAKHKSEAIVGPPEESEKKVADEPTRREKIASFFTDDPGLPRLWLRRVASVAVGISAYAALKRAGYIAAGGQMQPLTHELSHELSAGNWGNNVKHFLRNSWREGAATTMFGSLWWATDAWGSWYDKFFENLEAKKPLTEHQSKKYDELLQRVNEKEHAASRRA